MTVSYIVETRARLTYSVRPSAMFSIFVSALNFDVRFKTCNYVLKDEIMIFLFLNGSLFTGAWCVTYISSISRDIYVSPRQERHDSIETWTYLLKDSRNHIMQSLKESIHRIYGDVATRAIIAMSILELLS